MRIKIISGDEEARLTWRGALRDLKVPNGPQLVVDLGGGSTELVLGEGGEIVRRASLELGSARLTERFFVEDADGGYNADGLTGLTAYVDAELGRYTFDPQPIVVIGVAGTVTTLAALHHGLDAYDGSVVHGSTLTRARLTAFAEQFLPLDRQARRDAVALAPARADFLVAGATVLARTLAAAGVDAMVVSDRGLRFGLLEAP